MIALHKIGAIKAVQMSTTIPRTATRVTTRGDSSSEDLARRLRARVLGLTDIANPRWVDRHAQSPSGSRKVVAAYGFEAKSRFGPALRNRARRRPG
jgi:hypothetical protein